MMNNKDNNLRPDAESKPEKQGLCKVLEMEMTEASALMEAEALLDSKNSDYVQGFLNGYAHCLTLGERIDAINNEKDPGLF